MLLVPNGINSIGDYTFYHCTSLKTIVIPDKVSKIGNSVFTGCTSLESIVIPKDVASIGNTSFYNMSILHDIYYCGNSSEWEKISIGNNNGFLTDYATIYYYSEEEPTESGNYWYYVDGVPAVWS